MFSQQLSISNSMPVAGALYNSIQAIGKPMRVAKGKAIIRQGSYSSFFFYIHSGVFRSYTVVNGKEYGIGFAFQEDVYCCPQGLLTNMPDNYTIEAVRDSEVLVCDLKDFRIAYPGNCDEWLQGILAHYLQHAENNLIDALSLTAADRYEKLIETYPQKLQQVPLTHIAAYLGISQERLSRIRRKLT